jgi:hypothetical protein
METEILVKGVTIALKATKSAYTAEALATRVRENKLHKNTKEYMTSGVLKPKAKELKSLQKEKQRSKDFER